jgi:hypothetical protein
MDSSYDMLYHFHERQRAHLALPGLPLLCAIMEATVALTMRAALMLHIVQWIIVALFLAAAVLAREMIIRVNAEELIFGFGPIRHKIRLSDIKRVRVVDTTSLKTGLGFRRVADGFMAWIATPGSAVEVKTSSVADTRHAGFVISTSRPNDLAAALQSGPSRHQLEQP